MGLVLVVLYVRRKWLKFYGHLKCLGLQSTIHINIMEESNVKASVGISQFNKERVNDYMNELGVEDKKQGYMV